MKIAARNVILVIAISIIALMIVGIFLYDYIPTGMQVSQAKVYQADSNTIKALSDASDAQDLVLPSSDSSGQSQIARTEIVLQTYDLTKADLQTYMAAGVYDRGRSNPFAVVETTSTTNTQAGTAGTSTATSSGSGSSGSTNSSDGTFYNSTKTK